MDGQPSKAYARAVPAMISQPTASPSPGKGVLIRQLFDKIAARYDLVNHSLSCGLDFLWRKKAARMVQAWLPQNVLDLATGSGDLAVAISRACPEAKVVGADFSPEMLRVAQSKGLAHLVQADALCLPFSDASFDAVSIAFGLRNMESWPVALREMLRVLRPGGHLLVLDFSTPCGWLRSFYQFYLHRVLPKIAGIITGDKAAYEYLGASISTFPQGMELCRILMDAGFCDTDCKPLTGGVVSLYTARRPQ